jgi:hypothetical protein
MVANEVRGPLKAGPYNTDAKRGPPKEGVDFRLNAV